MVIYNKKISVVPLTTHIKVKYLNILKDLLIKKIRSLHKNHNKYFKKKPRIAVLGLNPHNSEFKKNSEEVKTILPVINILKKIYKIFGPYSSDTIFLKENLKF